MTDRERITAYIDSLDPGHGELCDEIAREAREQGVPVVRRETASFLETLVAAFQPLQILEIGTAVGYSALLMAQVMPARGHITTIENYEPRIRKARENLARAGQEERITLLEGDATRHLEGLSGPYDLIFVDGAKGQYIHWLPRILELLAPGGLLVSDNVLQDGDILASRFAVERRNRTIHARMREYLYTLKHTPGLITSILPVGDGVTVSVKEKMPSGLPDGYDR